MKSSKTASPAQALYFDRVIQAGYEIAVLQEPCVLQRVSQEIILPVFGISGSCDQTHQ